MEKNEFDQDLYPEIESYLGEFKVDNKKSGPIQHILGEMESHVTVFRRKNLSELQIGVENIYQQNLTTPDIDKTNPNKARSSCGRCRKLKKKCSRDLPECSSCISSEKLCVYVTRNRSVSSLSNNSANYETVTPRTTTPKVARHSTPMTTSTSQVFENTSNLRDTSQNLFSTESGAELLPPRTSLSEDSESLVTSSSNSRGQIKRSGISLPDILHPSPS